MILNVVHEFTARLNHLCERHILTRRMHRRKRRGHVERHKLIARFIGVAEMLLGNRLKPGAIIAQGTPRAERCPGVGAFSA